MLQLALTNLILNFPSTRVNSKGSWERMIPINIREQPIIMVEEGSVPLNMHSATTEKRLSVEKRRAAIVGGVSF